MAMANRRLRQDACWQWNQEELSLSRLNHWLPRGQTDSEIMQGTAEFHHEITNTVLPQPDPVFDDTTALDTAVDMLDAQPSLVQRLVGSVLLLCQLLPLGVSSA
jgi:hypothetical protein